jgi:hypothetical protein
MRSVVFSCHNNQELIDLSEALVSLKEEGVEDIVFFDLSSFYGEYLDPELLNRFSKRHKAILSRRGRFKNMGAAGKLFFSILFAFQLLFVCRKYKSSTVVVGVPMLVYRLAGLFSFGRLFVMSYLRGIIIESPKEVSVSSRLYFILKKVALGRAGRVISDYYADRVICIGDTTKDFVIGRSVPEANVVVLGSIYCDQRYSATLKLGSVHAKPVRQVVFISSALAAHGYVESQKSQTELIKAIYEAVCSCSGSFDVKFIVRQHPREDSAIYSEILEMGIDVDNSGLDSTVIYDSGTLFVSPLSTLLFELAYLGRRAMLVSNEALFTTHSAWYRGIKAEPVLKFEQGMHEYLCGGRVGYLGFDLSQIISTKHRGDVMAFFKDHIIEAR